MDLGMEPSGLHFFLSVFVLMQDLRMYFTIFWDPILQAWLQLYET